MIMLENILFVICIIALIKFIDWYKKHKYESSEYFQESGTSYNKVTTDKGTIGEYASYKKIKGIDPEYEKFLFNVYLPTGINKWTEVDIIYINRYGIFVIENKNYSGWIFGDSNSRMWTVVYKGGKKKSLYNPIMQNKKHIQKVREILCEKDLNTGAVRSIVCFNDGAELKKVPESDYDVKIINSRDLVSTLKANAYPRIDKEEIEQIYAALKIYANASDTIKQQHINNQHHRRHRKSNYKRY